LEFCIPNKKLDDLGGLDNFKAWLKQRDAAFSQSALDYGLPYPKGLLLVDSKVQENQLQLKSLRMNGNYRYSN